MKYIIFVLLVISCVSKATAQSESMKECTKRLNEVGDRWNAAQKTGASNTAKINLEFTKETIAVLDGCPKDPKLDSTRKTLEGLENQFRAACEKFSAAGADSCK